MNLQVKKLVLLLLFVSKAIVSVGQVNYQDVVYLKNGSIIRGVIIEQVIGKSIKIETAEQNVLVFKMDEIEKFTKEPGLKSEKSSIDNPASITGYRGIVEFGYQYGLNYADDKIKVNFINGYQFNPYLSLGLGTGLRYYLEDYLIMPFFVDFRTNLTRHSASPYLALGLGYSFDVSDGFDGLGFIFSPSAGYRFKVSQRSSLYIGLGYEMQNWQTSYYDGYYGYYSATESIGALSFDIGISF